MKVAVTGGTGFVGSHTVAELVRRGHEPRLLVRSPDRVRPALDPKGVGDVETAPGDVTDEAAVEAFLDGCDAVVHAASVYSLDPSATERIRHTNVRGTDVVLGTAHRLGLDPIVHVSSTVAFSGIGEEAIGPDAEPTHPGPAYAASKADSDRVARSHQEAGAPVVITYPGMVWGPHDPYFGDTCIIVRQILSNLLVLMPKGGWPITDVRDVARLHAAVLEPGRGPRRYFSPAHNLSVRELYAALSEVTGRWLPVLTLPGPLILPTLLPLAWLERRTGVRTPWSYDGGQIVAGRPVIDDSRTRSELGLEPMELRVSVEDTVRWMAEVGYLSKRRAGRAV